MSRWSEGLRVGVIGKDARTDAIAAACARSRLKPQLHALAQFRIPGLVATCDDVRVIADLNDLAAVRAWAGEVRPDVVIVGPEDPLAAGVVDELAGLGIPAFGPNRSQARVEGSKAWTRDLVAKYRIPGNPGYRAFRTADGLDEHLAHRPSFVLKPDGLTGGKGVRLFPEHFDTRAEALAYAHEILDGGAALVVEQQLEGEEFSLQTLTDGTTSIHTPAVQDHKRAYEGDEGPNTGGMGSYSFGDGSLPFLTAGELADARRINELVIDAIWKETGDPYCGVLYGGFMATADGVRLIEYNARFGDPEALNILPVLSSDFLEIVLAAVDGELASVEAIFEPLATVCKYLVPSGYPGGGGAGDVVTVPAGLEEQYGVQLYWAATNLVDGEAVLTGSRGLAVVGMAAALEEAEQAAEAAALAIEAGGNVRHRKDVGTRAVIQKRIDHMARLRA